MDNDNFEPGDYAYLKWHGKEEIGKIITEREAQEMVSAPLSEIIFPVVYEQIEDGKAAYFLSSSGILYTADLDNLEKITEEKAKRLADW